MIFFKLLTAAAIAQQVHAQIDIEVGEGGPYFVHPSLGADIGDVISFHFGGPGPMNHSIIQGSFDNPCHPLPNGFYSGFVPVPAGSQGSTTLFLVPINHTDPIYYYCGQIGHCQFGMVGVINPPCDGSGSFAAYQKAAKSVTSVGPLPSSVYGGYLVAEQPGTLPISVPTTPFPGVSAASTTGSGKQSFSSCPVTPSVSPTSVGVVTNGSTNTIYTVSPTSVGVGSNVTANATTSGILPFYTSGAISIHSKIRFGELGVKARIFQAVPHLSVIFFIALGVLIGLICS